MQATEQGRRTAPSPIGFYFANLWYFEELYPLIFAAVALYRVRLFLMGHRVNDVIHTQPDTE